MAIRVLLDHGVPGESRRRPAVMIFSGNMDRNSRADGVAETNIIFLTFLIARQGLRTARRAFPGVKIVTAAIDHTLTEMHLPLTSLVMGEAAGEGDFGVKLVNGSSSRVEDGEDQRNDDASARLDLEENALEGFKVKVATVGKRSTEELKFSRRHRESVTSGEKRVWVVSPGEWSLSSDSSCSTPPSLTALTYRWFEDVKLTLGMGHIGYVIQLYRLHRPIDCRRSR